MELPWHQHSISRVCLDGLSVSGRPDHSRALGLHTAHEPMSIRTRSPEPSGCYYPTSLLSPLSPASTCWSEAHVRTSKRLQPVFVVSRRDLSLRCMVFFGSQRVPCLRTLGILNSFSSPFSFVMVPWPFHPSFVDSWLRTPGTYVFGGTCPLLRMTHAATGRDSQPLTPNERGLEQLVRWLSGRLRHC